MLSLRRLDQVATGCRGRSASAPRITCASSGRRRDSRIEPPDAIERIVKQVPIILAMWHGQHFLTPFIRPTDQRAKVLISRHRDGEINAVAAERLGIETIRGSGDHGAGFLRKGGLFALQRSWSARCAEGHQRGHDRGRAQGRARRRARHRQARADSGRPIYPVAVATSRRIVLDNWDRTTINLPFGRGAGVAGAPIHVPPTPTTPRWNWRGARSRRRSTRRPRAPTRWSTAPRRR